MIATTQPTTTSDGLSHGPSGRCSSSSSKLLGMSATTFLVFLPAPAGAGVIASGRLNFHWMAHNVNTCRRDVQAFDCWVFAVCDLPKDFCTYRIAVFYLRRHSLSHKVGVH